MVQFLTFTEIRCFDTMHPISEILLIWYGRHRRNLPWRESRDPYRIWLSEVILQQTRVDQGLDYYHRFVEAFPTVQDLAGASEEQVLKLWQGLGYYSRARNLHNAARQVVEERHGRFPSTRDGLLTLKGVGPYTAAAVASIAFDEDVPVVDGNVHRVMARLFDLNDPVNQPVGHRSVEQAMEALLPAGQAATFNQAVMEFGALHCTPKQPGCNDCSLSAHCRAFQNETVSIRPVKAAKTKVKKVFFDYFIFTDGDQIVVRHRDSSGIWQNMYDFPCIEGDTTANAHQTSELLNALGIENSSLQTLGEPVVHVLSHRRITAQFHLLHVDRLPAGWQPPLRAVSFEKLHTLPVPRLIELALDRLNAALNND